MKATFHGTPIYVTWYTNLRNF